MQPFPFAGFIPIPQQAIFGLFSAGGNCI